MAASVVSSKGKYRRIEFRSFTFPAAKGTGTARKQVAAEDGSIIGGVTLLSQSGGNRGFYTPITIQRNSDTLMTVTAVRNGGEGATVPSMTVQYSLIF